MIRIQASYTRFVLVSIMWFLALFHLSGYVIKLNEARKTSNLIAEKAKTGKHSHSTHSGNKTTTHSGNVIHFIESSGEECLRPRQACSIESAAISNPDFKIHLHIANELPPGEPEPYEGEGLKRNCKIMELIKSFPNVKIIRENLLSHLKDTPLEELLELLTDSPYANQHLTDAVRVALIYKQGGIYVDIDTIIFRSLSGLRNAAGHVFSEGKSLIENGFLIFDRGSGFLKHLMGVMVRDFKRSDDRSAMGYVSLTKAFRNYCFHSPQEIDPSIFKYACKGDLELTLFNYTAFYSIGYEERDKFYNESFSQNDLQLFQHSYAIHAYELGHGVHIPETSLFAHLARKYCPFVYSDHERETYVF